MKQTPNILRMICQNKTENINRSSSFGHPILGCMIINLKNGISRTNSNCIHFILSLGKT